MKNFQVISKPNCSRCELLKDWLKKEEIEYEELSLTSPEVKNMLLDDEKFIAKFCDIDGCMVLTPVIRVKETGAYYSKQLFGIDGVRSKFIKETLEIE